MVIFRHFRSKNCQFSMNFHDNSKIKIGKTFFHSFQHIAHPSFMKVGSKLRGGVCLSLVAGPIIYFVNTP